MSFADVGRMADVLQRLQSAERELVAQKHQIDDLGKILLTVIGQLEKRNGNQRQPERTVAAGSH